MQVEIELVEQPTLASTLQKQAKPPEQAGNQIQKPVAMGRMSENRLRTTALFARREEGAGRGWPAQLKTHKPIKHP